MSDVNSYERYKTRYFRHWGGWSGNTCLQELKNKCEPRGNIDERVPGKGKSWCKGPEAGRGSYVGGTERGELTELHRVAPKGFYRLHLSSGEFQEGRDYMK